MYRNYNIFRPNGLKAATPAVLGILALVSLLVLTVAPGDLRASAKNSALEALFGTVVEVQLPDTLVVATDSGVSSLVIPTNDLFTGDITSVEDVSEGDRVVASVQVSNGVTSVDRLLIVPDLSKTVTRHILGVIIEHGDGTVSVQDRDGNTQVIDIPEGIDLPEPGTAVTAVAQLDRRTGRMLVNAFDRVENVVQRLQEAKDRVSDVDLRADLEARLERARDQHLTTLEQARQGLTRAQQALTGAISDRMEAQRQLEEVQQRFESLRERYVQEANNRNERLPELRSTGVLVYSDTAWLGSAGTFELEPAGNAYGTAGKTFTWNERTLAIVPVELRETDPAAPAITATRVQSVALPLNEVKSLIPSGSQVRVQYDANAVPSLATLITVLPPELPDAVADALEQERLRSITGVVTLVEETANLESVVGVVVVANRDHDIKLAAKVVTETEIEIDGEKADFSRLAAGMAVDIEFTAAQSTDALRSSQGSSADGKLNALVIRARTVFDEDEVHVAGVISGLSPETQTIGILSRNGETVRAGIARDGVIIKNGIEARFSSLALGDLVLDATRFSRDTLVLTRLVVQSPRAVALTGLVTATAREPQRLNVATQDGLELVIFVNAQTVIQSENATDIKFEDISVGDRVIRGEALPQQRAGNTVLVATNLLVGEPGILTARGVVRAVDPEMGRIIVRTGGSDLATGVVELVLKTDDTARSLLFKNDQQIRDMSTIEPGDIVESVAYKVDERTIVKMSVVSPNLNRIRGFVSAVTDGGLVVDTSTGRVVGLRVDADSQLTLNGRTINSLDPVKRGDVVSESVYISTSSDGSAGVAIRITLITGGLQVASGGIFIEPADRPVVESTVSGLIRKLSGDSWRIGDQDFLVTPNTRFIGDRPQEGLVAKATLVLSPEGHFIATAISVAGRPDVNPAPRPIDAVPVEPGEGGGSGLIRLLGRVQSVEGDGQVVSLVVVDGVEINILSNTIVAGRPEPGATALAVVRRTPGGNITAVTIAFRGSTDEATRTTVPGDTSPPVPVSPTPSPVPPSRDTTDEGKRDGDSSTGDSGSGEDTRNMDSLIDEAVRTGLETVSISIERIAGRIAIADGRVYLLTRTQATRVTAGAELELTVRKLDLDKDLGGLGLTDRLTINSNPLFETAHRSGVSALYVAQ